MDSKHFHLIGLKKTATGFSYKIFSIEPLRVANILKREKRDMDLSDSMIAGLVIANCSTTRWVRARS